MIHDAVADDVNDFAFLLKSPPHGDHGGRHDLAAVDFELVGPQDALSDAGFVFDRHEQDTLG